MKTLLRPTLMLTLMLTLVTILAFASTTVFADGIALTNQYGTATITDAGIFSHGSQLTSYNGVHAKPGHSLGSVTFSTGALTSGTILGGGTFSNVGSTFNVVGTGKGVPHGAIFTGSFTGPIAWALVSHVGQTYNFTLSGAISGMMFNGRTVTGFTTQSITLFRNQWVIDRKGKMTLGTTGLSTPEPNTLLLIGTGVVGMAGAFKRRLIG